MHEGRTLPPAREAVAHQKPMRSWQLKQGLDQAPGVDGDTCRFWVNTVGCINGDRRHAGRGQGSRKPQCAQPPQEAWRIKPLLHSGGFVVACQFRKRSEVLMRNGGLAGFFFETIFLELSGVSGFPDAEYFRRASPIA